MTISWPIDKENALQSLILAGGYSYSGMAHELGMTRNAVIGKAKRLRDAGVSWAPALRRTPNRSGRPNVPRRQRDDTVAKRVASKRAAALLSGLPLFDWSLRAPRQNSITQPVAALLPPAPESLRIAFFERTSMQCAWIDDEISEAVTCCGHTTVGRASYCSHHMHVAYVPAEAKGH